MNIKEYIESGILEAYAVGAVSDQEKREVQCMSKIYPEIAEQLEELQEGMEAFAVAQSIEPPQGLKASIMAAVAEVGTPEYSDETASTREVKLSPQPTKKHDDEEKELPPPQGIANDMRNGFTWAAAAVLLILIVASFYRQYEVVQMENHLAELQEINSVYEREVDEMVRVIEQKQDAIATLSDPERKKIVLKGTSNYSDAIASVYWDKEKGEVALDASVLPDLSEDEQYQLWALIGGKPVDMGMVEKGIENRYVQEMKAINQADAFAITIEPKGGKSTPTLEKLIVLGEV